LLCAAPVVTSVVAPAASAWAQAYSSLRTLLPPPPSPPRSSRFSQSVSSPIAAASRGAGSTGVGHVPSRTGGSGPVGMIRA
jgi:hypothetical protein